MRRVVKALLVSIPVILGLVVAPNLFVVFIPGEILSAAREVAGIDVQAMVGTVTFIGLVLVGLSFAKHLSEDRSAVKLIASALADLLGFYLFLTVVGLGDPSSWGFTERSLPVMGDVTLFLDFRFFVLTAALILFLKVGLAGFRFAYFRRVWSEKPVQEIGE